MKTIILKFIVLFLFSISVHAQMGIGTTDPSAALEVSTTDNGVASMRLNPQNNPTGTQTGQLTVIDGILYMFDAVRGKWLSLESTSLGFGRLGQGSDPAEVEYAGGDTRRSPIMPFDGTIVGISMSATNDNSREILLFLNETAVPNNDINNNIDGVFNLDQSTLRYDNNNFNLDFEAGDVLRFEMESDVNDIENLIVNIRIKWRQNN